MKPRSTVPAPELKDQTDVIKALAALAHDSRLSLMRHLIQAGPDGVGAGQLAAFAKIGATTASAQLLVLANAGLVRSTRTGRQVVYCANYEALRGIMAFLLHDCCGSRKEICTGLVADLAAAAGP